MKICVLLLFISIASGFQGRKYERFPQRFSKIEDIRKINALNQKQINFPNFKRVYNPSIVSINKKEVMFVRIEGDEEKKLGDVRFFDSYIGVSEKSITDEWGPIKKLPLLTKYAEDPRVIEYKGKILLFFNDLIDMNLPFRVMKIAVLNFNYEVENINIINPQQSYFEKNWAPFTISSDPDHFYYVYSFSPLMIYKGSIKDGSISVEKLTLPNDAFYTDLSNWENMWAKIRGGTPFVEYKKNHLISIFHSSIYSAVEGKRWYILGAVTLKQMSGNFYIDQISSIPIIYNQMYFRRMSSTADKRKRVLFPGGLSIKRNVATVYMGVNDSFVNQVSFNVEDLLKGMNDIR